MIISLLSVAYTPNFSAVDKGSGVQLDGSGNATVNFATSFATTPNVLAIYQQASQAATPLFITAKSTTQFTIHGTPNLFIDWVAFS